MLRNLTFVVQFAYFSIRPAFEQFFEKSRETIGKISSNLWKALGVGQRFIEVVVAGGILLLPPCLFPDHPPLLDLMLNPTLLGTFEIKMATHKGILPGVGSRSRRSYGKRGDCETTTTEQERIIQFSLATSSCVESSKVWVIYFYTICALQREFTSRRPYQLCGEKQSRSSEITIPVKFYSSPLVSCF